MSKPRRDPYFDTARFLLITLVVVGHALEPLVWNHLWIKAAFLCIYAFHIPTFAFISGRFSSGELRATEARSLVARILAPYAVFQGLYVLFARLVLKQSSPLFFTPYWLMWFLLSLACWKLMLPLVLRLRFPVLVATVVGLAAGCFPDGEVGYSHSLSRTLVFFPFFVLGYLRRADGLGWLRHRWPRLIAVAIVVGVAALSVRFAAAVNPGWLYGACSYAHFKVGFATGLAARALVYLIASLLGLAFLAFVPRRETPLAGWGARSMQTFLLHGFIVKACVALGAFKVLSPRLGALVASGAAVLVSLALSTRLVERVVFPLVHPPLDWLLVSEHKTEGAAVRPTQSHLQ
ncbi:MAG TPA: acyltransferase [Myxococcales bacterium]|nr:acyltransferase [Myxococcales bacterium]